MSIPLTAHDVRKQPGITSICRTSDVMKLSVTFRLLGSTHAPRAPRSAALPRCTLLLLDADRARGARGPRVALKFLKVPP